MNIFIPYKYFSYPSICCLHFRPKISATVKSKRKTCLTLQRRYFADTRQPFDEFPQRDLCSLNSQLARYTRNRNFLATWALFSHMQFVFPHLDAYTFTPVLGACSELPSPLFGKQVHAVMIKTGTDLGTVSKTALMDMYSKYGDLDDSVKVFHEMKLRDVVTWNALLSSFLRHGLACEGLGVLGVMRKEGVKFSEFTLCSVLKACAFLKAFRLGKQVHGLVVVMGRDMAVLCTALINFYSNVGYISEAIKVFCSFNWPKDDVMCNSLIAGCVTNRRYKEAFLIMSVATPNAVALTCALAACSQNSDLWIGLQIHGVAIHFGFMSDSQLCNVLLDMYAKCGKIFKARSVFDGICVKDVVSWTSMIDAYGRNGHGHEALELFKKMGVEESEVLPNSVTFLAVLSACGHSGLVEEGRELFDLARKKYGLNPGVEHYSCFIHILGRAGQLKDIWYLFKDMVKNGLRPTAAIWAVLLNACSLNLDVSTGEFVAKHLLELETNNPSNYVLLSNFYASIGSWDTVDTLRRNMREKGIIKEAAGSWIPANCCETVT